MSSSCNCIIRTVGDGYASIRLLFKCHDFSNLDVDFSKIMRRSVIRTKKRKICKEFIFCNAK